MTATAVNTRTGNPARQHSAKISVARQMLHTGWMLGCLCLSGPSSAQMAGTTVVVNVTLGPSAEPVPGWSVRHGLLGRPVYDDAHKQIGRVEDLVVTADKAQFVVVIGVGGFIEMGGHAVAVPLQDVVEQGGGLLLPGATRATLKAMPTFRYADAATRRAQFISYAAVQLSSANAQLALSQQAAAGRTGSARADLDNSNAALLVDITDAEDKLADLKKAEAGRWMLLREDVRAAVARVHDATSELHSVPAAGPAQGQRP